MGIMSRIARGVGRFERGAEKSLVKVEGVAAYVGQKREVYKSDVARLKAAKLRIFGVKKKQRKTMKARATKRTYLPKRRR